MAAYERPCLRPSVIQLQGELDLPWIVGSIARGPDLPKLGSVEVQRVTNGDDAVAAEAGGIKVRVIEDIEEL